MIEVYAFSTPNSVRVPIALEELGLDYELKSVNVKKAEQKSPDFLALNPNGKVPVLIDPDGPAGEPITLTESGAILVYLAEKTGRLLPQDLGAPLGRLGTGDDVGKAAVFLASSDSAFVTGTELIVEGGVSRI